jgi:hypothetical protein
LAIGSNFSGLFDGIARKQVHEAVAVHVIDIDACNVSVVKGRSAADTAVVPAMSAIENASRTASVCSSASCTRELGALEGLGLGIEIAQKGRS